MIVQICGTNGAGKSTLVRKLMDEADELFTHYSGDKIDGYTMHLGDHKIQVVGPYENPTGGCDTYKKYEEILKRVRGFAERGYSVIFEGAGFAMNQTRGPALAEDMVGGKKIPFIVVLLTTPFGQCLEGLTERRAARGVGPMVDITNIRGNHQRAQNYTARMRDAGASVIRTDRDKAVQIILDLFN